MTPKKIPTAPEVTLLSETALAASVLADNSEGTADVLSVGLGRTLARRRSDRVALPKGRDPAKQVKTGPLVPGKPAKRVRKVRIGPRSGHK